MKKRLVSIVVGLLLGMGGNAWAGNVVAADLNCTNPAGCVQTDEISDGAVTDPKLATSAVTNGKIADGAVTNSKLADWSVSGSKIVDFSITDTKISSNAVSTEKIADGAVTDAKIVGPISGSKLGSHTHDGADIVDGTVVTSKISDGAIADVKITGPISASKLEKPANVIVVAKSGGDFTSIQAAIDSINPTADNPYLIKVMPGTYVESITMKSYIHLQGSGRDVTIINGGVTILYVASISITDLTLSGISIGSPDTGLESAASIMISDCLVGGVGIWSGQSITIKNNIIRGSGNYGSYDIGIYIYRYAESLLITDNLITKHRIGIFATEAGASVIRDNTITSNASWGIYAVSRGPITVIHNKITDNGMPEIGEDPYWRGYGDISSEAVNINISFNVINSISAYGGGIAYNVKSDGTPL